MTASYRAGGLLTMLGLSMVIATGSPTAAIPALFGLLLFGAARMWQRAGRERPWAMVAVALGVLGLLAPIGNLARVISAGGFTLNAASFANLTMMLICAAYLLALIIGRARQTR